MSCGRYPTDPALRTVPAAGADLPREHPGQGGLSRAVPADQADLVAVRDLERGGLQQQAGASAQLKVVCGYHFIAP